MSSPEERAMRRAALEGTMERLGAKPYPAWEPPSDCVWLTSVEKRFRGIKGGMTMEVGKRAAAELIVDGTHALSTEAEIAAYHADELRRKQEAFDAKNFREGRVIVYVEPAATEPPTEHTPAVVESKRKR